VKAASGTICSAAVLSAAPVETAQRPGIGELLTA